MKLALISFSKEDSKTSAPVALLPLFDGTIAKTQVRLASQLGAEKIIFLSPNIPGALLRYTDELKRTNIDVEIVRSARDLMQYASDQDEILVIADGVIPGTQVLEKLGNMTGEIIFVVDNAKEYTGYERIDRNHCWLGIAKLKAARLAALGDVPDDWDVSSALLRTAVQAECMREIISYKQMSTGAVSKLDSADSANLFSEVKLAETRTAKGNFLDKIVIWPLTRKLLPQLWKTGNATRYLGFSSLFLGLVGVGLAYLGYTPFSLGFLLLGATLLKFMGRISIFSSSAQKLSLEQGIFSMFLAVALAILVFGRSGASVVISNMVILAVFFGALLVSRRAWVSHKLRWIEPDKPLVLLILLLFSLTGSFVVGLYVTTLLCIGYLIACSHFSASVHESGSDHR